MEILNTELYVFIVIVLLFLSYTFKYRKDNIKKSLLYYSILLSILLLIICNICLYVIGIRINSIWLLIPCVLAVIPPALIFLYIKTAFFNREIFFKQYFWQIMIFIILYTFIVVVFLNYSKMINCSLDICTYYTNIKEIKYLLLITLIPSIYILIELIYRTALLKQKNNYYIFIGLIISISFVCFDLIVDDLAIITFGYALSALCIYLYRIDTAVNVDSLTGLNNRYYLNALSIENRRRELIGILVIDVDNFKTINDTYGHTYGDSILIEVGLIIKKSVRSNDITIRYGGDEFVIIVNSCNIDSVSNIKKKLLENVDKSNKINNYNISLSVGDCIVNKGETLMDGIRIADEKMYIEKKQKKGNNKR